MEFEFTQDWFRRPRLEIEDSPFKNVGNFKSILEIGCFEGRSTSYWIQNKLSDVGKITIIDPFSWKPQDTRFHKNILPIIKDNQTIDIKRGISEKVLLNLVIDKFEKYDFIYIDGDHSSRAVIIDAMICWDLLEVGGYLAFDDYRWTDSKIDAPEYQPKLAIDVFLKLKEGQYKLLIKKWVVLLQKL